jgi:hypothetical protein
MSEKSTALVKSDVANPIPNGSLKRDAAKPEKAVIGRPRLVFDLGIVKRMAAQGCTDLEIFAVLGCSKDTFYDRKKSDPAFAEALKKGRAAGRVALRRLQWKQAIRGNTTMLIWLGKQLLGQTDKQRVEIEAPDRERQLPTSAEDARTILEAEGVKPS